MEIFGFGCSWKLKGMHIWKWSKYQWPFLLSFNSHQAKNNIFGLIYLFQIYVNIGPVRVRDDEEVVNQDQAF